MVEVPIGDDAELDVDEDDDAIEKVRIIELEVEIGLVGPEITEF